MRVIYKRMGLAPPLYSGVKMHMESSGLTRMFLRAWRDSAQGSWLASRVPARSTVIHTGWSLLIQTIPKEEQERHP